MDVFEFLTQWIEENKILVWSTGASSILLFGSLIVLMLVIVRLPADIFIRNGTEHPGIHFRNPSSREPFI
ncbi:MAG: hypothetical protein ACOC0U_07365 [Desulfovibrionales bacterium]